MYCTNCGEQMNDNQAICLKCGVQKGTSNKYCENCGTALTEGQAVCIQCGVAVKKAGGGALNGKLGGQDKLTMALICFFLGSIGIHNFMMGETKKGIVKIVGAFLCGLSSILALIDFIKILTDKYEVDPEKLF